MKITIRRRKRGSTSISFRAGRGEGADLAAAVLESVEQRQFSAAGIIEKLGERGYRGTAEEITEGSHVVANPMSQPATVDDRKEQHFRDVRNILILLHEEPNRAAAAYLMGVMTVVTNAQASRNALESACRLATTSVTGLISGDLISRSIEIAMADCAE